MMAAPAGAKMDPLSQLLRSVRLTGALFLDGRFSAPWCIESQIAAGDCEPFMQRPAQIIAYHLVVDGRLLLGIDGHEPIEVNAGEIVILPRNEVHTLASALDLAPVNSHDLILPVTDGCMARIVHGGGGEKTRIFCGFFGSDETHDPLLSTLPRVLKLDVRQDSLGEWVEASVQFAASELARGTAASSNVISRLSELLLVEAVRRYASTLQRDNMEWLQGLQDPYVARALSLVNGRIDAPWTAEKLAKEVALSRSAFNDRFTGLVGVSPIRYLTLRRLQVAKERLRASRHTVAQIAHSVGYESEVAFNRAFKREVGQPPARWREMQKAG